MPPHARREESNVRMLIDLNACSPHLAAARAIQTYPLPCQWRERREARKIKLKSRWELEPKWVTIVRIKRG